jgi:hypothetical protein
VGYGEATQYGQALGDTTLTTSRAVTLFGSSGMLVLSITRKRTFLDGSRRKNR